MSSACRFCQYYGQHHNTRCCCAYCYRDRMKCGGGGTEGASSAAESTSAHPCPHAHHPHHCPKCVLPPYCSARGASALESSSRATQPHSHQNNQRVSSNSRVDGPQGGTCGCGATCACRRLVRPRASPRTTLDPLDVPKMGPRAMAYMRGNPHTGQNRQLDERLKFLY